MVSHGLFLFRIKIEISPKGTNSFPVGSLTVHMAGDHLRCCTKLHSFIFDFIFYASFFASKKEKKKVKKKTKSAVNNSEHGLLLTK